MKYTQLGQSKIQISRQGLGCMGMSEFYGKTDEKTSIDVIQSAMKQGINFFDTADMYGFGENEKLLAKAIKGVELRESIVIATKCGIVRDKHNPTIRQWNNSPEYIHACCNNSLERLDTYIDLYYLHRVVEEKLSIKQAMKAMAELIQQEKIRSVGLSEVSSEYLRMAHDYLLEYTNGQHGVSAVQTEYSLITRDVEHNDVLSTCQDLGISFIAYSPIGRGLLSGVIKDTAELANGDCRKNLPRFNQENIGHNLKLVEAMNAMADEKDCTLAQLALAWVHHTGAVPIPGTKQQAYLKQNIAAENIELTHSEFQKLSELSTQYKTKGSRY